MFASEHWDLVGDIMTVAKGLSSGYAPIGAAICRPKVVEVFTGSNEKKLAHLLTFGGQAVACAAALANLDILQRENLVDNAANMGAYLLELLQGLAHHPTVGDVRGIGLLSGVELVKNRDSKEKFAIDSEEVKTLNALLANGGLLTRASHIIFLAPPLCITRAEVERMVEIIDNSITTFEQQFGYH